MTAFVALGFAAAAAAGTLVRFWVAAAANRPGLPLGTFMVNVVGSLALGLAHGLGPDALTVLGVGGLGSLTTWSTLTAETLAIADDGTRWRAAGYMAASLGAGIGAAWLGMSVT